MTCSLHVVLIPIPLDHQGIPRTYCVPVPCLRARPTLLREARIYCMCVTSECLGGERRKGDGMKALESDVFVCL